MLRADDGQYGVGVSQSKQKDRLAAVSPKHGWHCELPSRTAGSFTSGLALLDASAAIFCTAFRADAHTLVLCKSGCRTHGGHQATTNCDHYRETPNHLSPPFVRNVFWSARQAAPSTTSGSIQKRPCSRLTAPSSILGDFCTSRADCCRAPMRNASW